jgi:hypothetical protein
MTQSQQLSEDLQYVRQAVDRRGRRHNIPAPIAWAVAIYVAVGYTLLDVNPLWAGWSFMIGGVALGAVSWVVGRGESLRTGEYDRAEVTRIWMHWFSIVLAIVGVIALAVTRGLQGPVVGQMIVLAIGLIYFLGGVHFDRNLLWLGPVMMAGGIAIGYVPHYGWTALGAVIALGLVVPTLLRARAVALPQSQTPADRQA